MGDQTPAGSPLREVLAREVQYNQCLQREFAKFPDTDLALAVMAYCQIEKQRVRITVNARDIANLQPRLLGNAPFSVAIPNPFDPRNAPTYKTGNPFGSHTTGLGYLAVAGAFSAQLFFGPNNQLLYRSPDGSSVLPLNLNEANDFVLGSGFNVTVTPYAATYGASVGRPAGAHVEIDGRIYYLNFFDSKTNQSIADPANWNIETGTQKIKLKNFKTAGPLKVSFLDTNGNQSDVNLSFADAGTGGDHAEVIGAISGEFIGGNGPGPDDRCREPGRCTLFPTGENGALERWQYSSAGGVHFQRISAAVVRFIGKDGFIWYLYRDTNGQLSMARPNPEGTLSVMRQTTPGRWETRTVYPGGYYDPSGYSAASGGSVGLPQGQSLGELLFGSFYDGPFAGIKWNLSGSNCGAPACTNNPNIYTTCYGVLVPVFQASQVCGELGRQQGEERLRQAYRYDFSVDSVTELPSELVGGAVRAASITVKNTGGSATFPWTGPFYALNVAFFATIEGQPLRVSSITVPTRTKSETIRRDCAASQRLNS